MVEKDILTLAKTYQLKIEISKEKMRMLISSRKYATTIVDVTKKKEIELQIKALNDYIVELEGAFEQFKQGLETFSYVLSNYKERIIFKEFILNDKSAKKIIQEHPDLELSEKTIYNIACQIKKELKHIKIDRIDVL